MKIGGKIAIGAGALIGVAVGVVVYSSVRTEADIDAFRSRISAIGVENPAPNLVPAELLALPEPVQRYFNFVFIGPVSSQAYVQYTAEGQFRIPQTDEFNFTTAEQTIAIGEPALMFSATTPVMPGIWARAYDFFADGRMEMKAKILSTLTVVDECETPELNRISLRRWLLESALFPQALLPGGPVSWEPISDSSARATVTADGMSASMIAHFDAGGSMTHMTAEEDGDLSTPYHGSGEHVTRSDYRPVGNQMIPYSFTISRAAAGKLYPFFKGTITNIRFVGGQGD